MGMLGRSEKWHGPTPCSSYTFLGAKLCVALQLLLGNDVCWRRGADRDKIR
jgi:hypothetical protein